MTTFDEGMSPGFRWQPAADIVKQALENKAKIAALREEGNAAHDALDNERKHLKYEVYEPKIRALRDECEERVHKAEEVAEAKDDEREARIQTLYGAVNKAGLIVHFLKLETKDLGINDDEVNPEHRYGSQGYKEALGPLFEDDHLTIRLYILENSKPKNKFTLCALGKSDIRLPGDDRLFPYEYGVPVILNPHYYPSLQAVLREGPSVEELKAWVAKNRDALVMRLTTKYKRVKIEYENARAAYKLEDFAALEEKRD